MIAMAITTAVAIRKMYVLAPAGQPRLIRAPETTIITTAMTVMNQANERVGTRPPLLIGCAEGLPASNAFGQRFKVR